MLPSSSDSLQKWEGLDSGKQVLEMDSSPKNDPLTGSERGSQFSEAIGKSEES